MNPKAIFLQLLSVSLAINGFGASTPAVLLNSLTGGERGSEILERGQDFAVVRAVTTTTDTAGGTSLRTNQFTLLENGLHYEANGHWEVSEDVVEPFPGGAIARRGPWKTIFSSDLNSETVFDIETPEGQRIRGGVRAIQLTDLATGMSVVLGTVKKSVPGVVVPPNQVVYEAAFDGLDADVLFVSRHNSISQNVILKNRPTLPKGMDPATTRLEVVTELIQCPEPTLNSVTVRKAGQPDLRDDVTLGFGSLQAMRGKAFPVSDAKALVLTGGHLADDSAISVVKQFHRLADGRKFVIESVGWLEIQPSLKGLLAAKVEQPQRSQRMADARTWPKRIPALAKKEPLQMASLPYKTSGFLVDIDLSGSTTKGYTFLKGTTYYIAQSFYIAATSTTTFQAGCVIKYGYDAWLLLHCPISCPPTGQLMPVLTSKDDDQFGEMVSGSTHNPTVMARQALLVYYVAESTTDIRNMRVRWASKGIEYDAYSGVPVAHILSDFLFQRCANNVYANMPNGFLTLNNVRTCNASIPLSGSYGALSGGFTEDCGPFYTVANFAGPIQQYGPNQQLEAYVPDTMGCAGPKHFMSVLNSSAAVYDKYTGLRLSQNTANEFFSLTIASGPYAGVYPNCAGDPQMIYDHLSQRWIACAMENCSTTRGILLAISNGDDPVGSGGPTWISDKWKKYLVPFPGPLDYPTLGVDGNGIYLIANSQGGGAAKIAALPKAQFLDASAPSVPIYFMFDGPDHCVPSVNFDPVTASSPAWFVYRSGGGAVPWSLNFNALKWTSGFTVAPEWQDPINWTSLSLPFGSIGDAPQLGSSERIRVQGQIDAYPKAVFARSIGGIPYLWLSVKLSVNGGGIPDSVGDRWAIQWLKIRTSPNVMVADSDRFYDSAPTNPRFYYMPSVSVNKIGDMVIGFSGSSANEYVSTYYSGKLNNGVSPSSPIKYFTGKDWVHGDPRWGDYSFTSLDPDGLTIWTIQEYAETRYAPFFGLTAWGLRIAAITPF